jgi:phosphate starvation-inducible membrane PsiE
MPNRIKPFADKIGTALVTAFHLLALFAIGAAIAWSATLAFWQMMSGDAATIEDILTLFIYLELGAMVGIYFKTMRMPVRFLIYVAITALTRMMIGRINVDHIPDLGIIYIAAAILILAIAVFIVKYASSTYPSGGIPEEQIDSSSDTIKK